MANQYGLFQKRQSAYRQHHWTETAATIVHNDIVHSTDASLVSTLVLLDLSAAFDTSDHSILLGILSKCFGVETGSVHITQVVNKLFKTPADNSDSVSLT